MNYICRNILYNNTKSYTPIEQCELCGDHYTDCNMYFSETAGWICECCLEDYLFT